MKLQTPSISSTPGLLSLEYDMMEDFLRDLEILGVYDIYEHPEDAKTNITLGINDNIIDI